MSKADEQIRISDDAICKLIAKFELDERGFLSQNILDKLRTFVEAVAVKASGEEEYSYDIFQNKAKHYISSRADLKFLSRFHKFLQQTLSHYLPDEEKSERLMLKYYEHLLKIKYFLKNKYNFNVLENINEFPIKIDPALQEYYKKITDKINESISKRKKSNYDDSIENDVNIDSITSFVGDEINDSAKAVQGSLKDQCRYSGTVDEFKLKLAEYITPETSIYKELEACIF
jgi:hypothetical protein